MNQCLVYKKVSVHISKLSPNLASNVFKERRMLNLVITLVCCYVTCWLPYHATRIFMFFVCFSRFSDAKRPGLGGGKNPVSG